MAETVTVFFPVYRDELTVGRVTDKAIDVCRRIADDFEVIIVDDGSPDRAGAIAANAAIVDDHPHGAGAAQPRSPYDVPALRGPSARPARIALAALGDRLSHRGRRRLVGEEAAHD